MKVTIHFTEATGGGCRASCPSLPGCFVRGSSEQDAAKRIKTAIHAYLASLDVAVPEEIVVWPEQLRPTDAA